MGAASRLRRHDDAPGGEVTGRIPAHPLTHSVHSLEQTLVLNVLQSQIKSVDVHDPSTLPCLGVCELTNHSKGALKQQLRKAEYFRQSCSTGQYERTDVLFEH